MTKAQNFRDPFERAVVGADGLPFECCTVRGTRSVVTMPRVEPRLRIEAVRTYDWMNFVMPDYRLVFPENYESGDYL